MADGGKFDDGPPPPPYTGSGKLDDDEIPVPPMVGRGAAPLSFFDEIVGLEEAAEEERTRETDVDYRRRRVLTLGHKTMVRNVIRKATDEGTLAMIRETARGCTIWTRSCAVWEGDLTAFRDLDNDVFKIEVQEAIEIGVVEKLGHGFTTRYTDDRSGGSRHALRGEGATFTVSW